MGEEQHRGAGREINSEHGFIGTDGAIKWNSIRLRDYEQRNLEREI